MLHVLAQVMPSPFEWASNHLHLIGWPAIVFLAWKASTAFSKISSHFTKAVGQIDQLATNHFPHMEASLARQDIYLSNIDKNIERLADKS